MVSRRQVASLHLVWLQELLNVFPGQRKVLYSDLARLNFQCQPADNSSTSPVKLEAQLWPLCRSVGVCEQVALSACSKREMETH